MLVKTQDLSTHIRAEDQRDIVCFKLGYTDTNVCDPELRQRIEEALEEIDKLKEISPPLLDDWEFALELGTDGETGEPICSYYFVCISTRCLFWLHNSGLGSLLLDMCGVTERTQICKSAPMRGVHEPKYKNRPGITSSVLVGNRCIPTMASWFMTLRSRWEAFPHNRKIPERLMQELTGILVHTGICTSEPGLDVMGLTCGPDCMTSPNFTAIYSEGEVNKLFGYVRYIELVGGNLGFSACVVGRSNALPPIDVSNRVSRSLDVFFFGTFPFIYG